MTPSLKEATLYLRGYCTVTTTWKLVSNFGYMGLKNLSGFGTAVMEEVDVRILSRSISNAFN